MTCYNINITSLPGDEEWRGRARALLQNGIPPDQVVWQGQGAQQQEMFAQTIDIPSQGQKAVKIQRSVLDVCDTLLLHSDPLRFHMAYRLVWRTVFENRNLLHIKTDPDILKIQCMVKAVRRDAYKITAFLRFREIELEGREHFIAWYEPQHYILEKSLGFFTTRFKNMNWSILTPYRGAHWNGHDVYFEDNPDKSAYLVKDCFEERWVTYYKNIFNPARTKKKAMLSQMPKKYWANLPEADIIPDLLKTSEARTKEMILKSSSSWES